MPTHLSEEARRLLSALIHDDRNTWWTVVPDKDRRNKAMDELADHGLVEIRMETRECRASARGRESHRRARAAGLI